MPAPETVKQLLDTFANNIDFYEAEWVIDFLYGFPLKRLRE